MTMGPAGASTEVEQQFDAPDLEAVARWLASQPAHAPVQIATGRERVNIDTYFDTEDWAVYRARYTLRVRRVGDTAEATLKAFGTTEGNARVRTEINQPLDSPDADVLLAGGPVTERLRLMLGTRRVLRPLFTAETQRRPFALVRGGVTLATLTLDDARIGSEAAGESLRRVEVEEDRPGALAQAGSFIEAMQAACGLAPATASKFESGLHASALTPEAGSAFGETEASADGPVDAYAYAVLRRVFAEFARHESGTRLGEDAEVLHQMRVATRRLRAMLSSFAPALPEAMVRWRDEFRWVAAALGEVRDMDVQLETLHVLQAGADWEHSTAVGPLIGIVDESRVASRARLIEALDSDAFAMLVDGFGEALRTGPPPQASATMPVAAREFGRLAIRRRYRRFRRDGVALTSESPAVEYHAVRVRGKRLRYTLEPFVPVFRQADALLAAVRGMQDLLGEHQDAEMAIARMRILAQERGNALPPDTLLLMGELSERWRVAMATARAGWPRAFARVRRCWREVRFVIPIPAPPRPPKAPSRPKTPRRARNAVTASPAQRESLTPLTPLWRLYRRWRSRI